MPAVTFRNVILLVALSVSASAHCFAQEAKDFPDFSLSREQWLQRVEDARRRSEAFVESARKGMTGDPAFDGQEVDAADQRAMNDPSLQPGDIIATSRGFFVFVGRENEEHRPGDFLPAPHPQHSNEARQKDVR